MFTSQYMKDKTVKMSLAAKAWGELDPATKQMYTQKADMHTE